MILTITIWFIASVLAMCFVEYVVHRWPMHNANFARRFRTWGTFESHAVLHHGRFFKEFENEPDIAARYISFELSPWFNIAGLSPAWLPLLLSNVTIGAVVIIVVAGLHGFVWTAIHSEMHAPSGRWFGKTKIFRYIRDYHRTHHEHPGCNYNAVFPPLADMVFGTYRRPTL